MFAARQVTMPPPSHQPASRAPLAPSDLYNNEQRRPIKSREPEKQSAPSSPKKTAAAKASSSKKPELPSPPKVIIDSEGAPYQRGALLGQGGFARVYEAVDRDGGAKAFKVIAKSAIAKSKKNRSKILAEIMIHRSLNHTHIVKFQDCFEDEENVYFKLELCRNGSLNDVVKKRGSFSEPEARYFMVQILCGCQNMHQNSVIHRDLKLGNIFLDENMQIKIGDFGLAALLKYPEERKKTVCGTPNYIAPEVLYDQGQGHSYEVDVWSVGVIMYTLLIGKPPFQTNNVDEIYQKIKHNDYQIPASSGVSVEAKDLITRILTPIPTQRPSLVQIMNHAWFRAGSIPFHLPSSTTKREPPLPLFSHQESLRNLEMLKIQAQWNPDADKEFDSDETEDVYEQPSMSARDEMRQLEQAEVKRERIDREFQKAIEPGSPISALIKAGRQPLVKAPTQSIHASLGRNSATSLARQLSSLALSRQQGGATATSNARADKENAGPSSMAPPHAGGPKLSEYARNYIRNLAPNAETDKRRTLQQKTRLVAGMSSAAVAAARGEGGTRTVSSGGRVPNVSAAVAAVAAAFNTSITKRLSTIEQMIEYLGEASDALDHNELYTPTDCEGDPIEVDMIEVADDLNGTRLKPESPKVFMISWLDHSERYGLGYALSDGTVGVNFRDATNIILSPTKRTVDYIYSIRSRPNGTGQMLTSMLDGYKPSDQLRCENYMMPTSDSYQDGTVPKDLVSRVKVMRYFENEIMERLYGADSPLTYIDRKIQTGMPFLHKWYRYKEAIVFRLSNSTVQFNFYDHTKMFLTHGGLVISVIEPVERTNGIQVMKSWTLEEFVSIAATDRTQREALAENEFKRNPRLIRPNIAMTKPTERRLVRSLIKKLKYLREALVNNPSASSSSSSSSSSSTATTTTLASSATNNYQPSSSRPIRT